MTSDLFGSAVASAWAGALVIAGLAGLIDGPRLSEVPDSSVRLAGIAALAAGIFVFSALVSDRLFTHADRRLVIAVEAGLAGLFGTALLVSIALFVVGAPS